MRFKPYILPNVRIINAASEGKCIAKHEEKVIMVEYGVPGDVADLKIYGKQKKYLSGFIDKLLKPSPNRVEPFCSHYGFCGGCKWQHMDYVAQLRYKQQQVVDAFQRIGKFPFPEPEPIIGAEPTTYYRNKLEYNFTHQRWLKNLDEKETLSPKEHLGLGFHIPGRFDKIFDVEKCYLQDDLQNEIRNSIKKFTIEKGYEFYNLYTQIGYLRSIILRNNLKGEWMLNVVFGNDDEEKRNRLLNFIKEKFPQITSLVYMINEKKNDSIVDLDFHVYHGKDYLEESLEGLKFKIGPKSFFQTNTRQALQLYTKTSEFAGLTGNEIVYDLYCGVGTISNFIAAKTKFVIGIESIEKAIEDAKENSKLNSIENVKFFAGDMKKVLTEEFFQTNGIPDVIITDPPRTGMDVPVIEKILESNTSRIVYVSCNPATQARDIALMTEKYEVIKVQPVDMFPHTHHVENIALLHLKN